MIVQLFVCDCDLHRKQDDLICPFKVSIMALGKLFCMETTLFLLRHARRKYLSMQSHSINLWLICQIDYVNKP